MDNPALTFLYNQAGEREGLADAGIESFRDDPYASCAREAGQNSRDAAVDVYTRPVKMSFNVFQINKDEFPSLSELTAAIGSCKTEASQDRDREFFDKASDVVSAEQIQVLEISDSNTLGLKGPPNEEGSPFHSLVKASGVTVKEGPAPGGSFGIGKNASYAVSDLQMVFYATKYIDDHNKEVFAAQGKVKLVSHTDNTGQKRRATGYWGHPEEFGAVTADSDVPDWMKRESIGTSIFCMGFKETENWASRIVYSLVSNFFTAIYRNEILFEVDNGRIQIDSRNVESLFSATDIIESASNAGHLDDLIFAKQLYHCLNSSHAEEKMVDIPGLGQIKFRVLVEEGMPKRIGFVRNGMLITSNLKYFGEPLQRFPSSQDFVVLVEPNDDHASEFLKRLENPLHNSFSAERINDRSNRAEATKAMKTLVAELRNIIKSIAGIKESDAVALDELSDMFSELGDSTSENDNNPEEVFWDINPRRSRTPPPPGAGGKGNGGLGGGPNGKGEGKDKGKRNRKRKRKRRRIPPEGSSAGLGSLAGKPIQLEDVRNIIKPGMRGSSTSRKIYFTPSEGGVIELKLMATGLMEPEKINITSSDSGTVKLGSVSINATKGERYAIDVSFDESYDGPVELQATLVNQTQEMSA